MKTKAVRIYGKNDLRLEEFELPAIKDDEMLAKVISDSLCMSSYKAAIQGPDHKRVPDNVHENPTIIGHEFCGEIVEVGKDLQHLAKPGDKFTVQPAMFYKGSLDSPGYSYPYYGGDATYIILPREVFLANCYLNYSAEAFYFGSLAEPVSCIIGAYHTSYHTKLGCYNHDMGIVDGGKMAILAGVGPMGLGAIDYAIHNDRRPSLLVITDIDDDRLARAARLFTPEDAAKYGVELHYVNTKNKDEEYVMSLTGGTGFDDIFVFAPVKPVVEMADRMLGVDGCLNFFAGPIDHNFKAEFNFYSVHYNRTHICGNTGGNTQDMIEALEMMADGRLNSAVMITHVGGLTSAVETTLNLHDIPGGKKLIYTQIDMPLVALDDFEKLGETDPMFAELAKIIAKTNNLWNPEAEAYLLANAKKID